MDPVHERRHCEASRVGIGLIAVNAGRVREEHLVFLEIYTDHRIVQSFAPGFNSVTLAPTSPITTNVRRQLFWLLYTALRIASNRGVHRHFIAAADIDCLRPFVRF